MIHEADERGAIERARFSLRFACEDCGHFAVEKGRCSLEYPNADHRADAPSLTGRLVFCKEFELA